MFFINVNFKTPYIGEDYALMSFSYFYEPQSLLEILKLTFMRIIKQITTWNVRIGEQISIVFGSFNKGIFNVLNSVVSMLYIYLIFIYAFGRRIYLNNKKDLLAIITIFMLIIGFNPVIGEVFFWQTGSCNYLWAISMLLVFGIPIRILLNGCDVINHKKTLIVGHTILGLLAGLTNENTVIVFLLLYFLIIIKMWVCKEKISIWVYSSFISLLMGFIIMIKAPSTKIRIEYYNEIYKTTHNGIQSYLMRIENVIRRFFVDNKLLLIIALIIILIYILSRLSEQKKGRVYKYNKLMLNNIIMLGLSGVSVAALIASPYIETRSFMLFSFFIITCIIYFTIQIFESYDNTYKLITTVFIGIFSVCGILGMTRIYTTYALYNQYVSVRQNEIIKKRGQDTIVYKNYDYKDDRILTTREDYLIATRALNSYFESNIILGETLEIKDEVILSNIEKAYYNLKTDSLMIDGWAFVSNINADNSNIYILLQSEDNSYRQSAIKSERSDVGGYHGSNDYLSSGFSLQIENVKDTMKSGIYNIGIYIENDSYEKELFILTETKIEIE